ncbi:hypothetical protein CIPAW_12G133900 [Carya illinoinensis]|uniref:PHD-type domain-containing protein n=1 Tax=Carya illinoinensis TaxID=32201 RepID=A0A8T1P056_CARIL|nr:hypothetical protein CIPAW_12G133900 [Carya illinoinensis]KAG6634673.1 hypothetical protein CIPAW_12G133900 [Carya illinoinensis]KAG6634674.1 hypothetical protein CIPAW_12G133900 [Carya illinoinensis]
MCIESVGMEVVWVNSSADHPMVTAPAWSIQTQSASVAKSGQEYRLSNLTSAKAEGTIDASTSQVPTQTARDQSSRPFITQTAPVDLPSIHQAVQGMSFVQSPSPGNSHNEIAKLIQKLLQPQHPEHPKWTPPSRDYLNKALTCQMCQLTINEVDNVLICDACEEGYHLKCLQPNQNGIPRNEWHCMGCLALTQGKPLPPKYGRVMRSSMNQPNLSSDIAMKVNQLKMTANGSSGLWSPAHAGTADTNYVDSASDIKIPDARENQGNNSASSIKNVDEKPFAGVHTNIPLKPLSVGSSSVNSIQNAKDCELSTREERSFEEEIDPPAKVSEKVGNNPYHSLPSHNSHVDWRDLSNCAESHVRENIDHSYGYDAKQDDQLVSQANPSGGLQTFMGAIEHSGSPSDGLCGAEWIGNVVQVLDEKSFYPSCRVSGIILCGRMAKLVQSGVIVTRCYFPCDLPENVGHPCSPESNEVYESNLESTIMAILIQGPCEVLPPPSLAEKVQPVFLCEYVSPFITLLTITSLLLTVSF